MRDLFIRVDRLLASPEMAEAFEGRVARSLSEGIDRLADYYGEQDGRLRRPDRRDARSGAWRR